MNTPARHVRAAVFVLGALLAGALAAVVSTVAPAPFPFAVGFAVAVPVMDVALNPETVPAERDRAIAHGIVAGLAGIVVGCAVGALTLALALGEYATIGLTAAATFLAAEYGGRVVLGRVP
ncbi:uncharacterized protein (DUF697 family) [Halarchaeum solikamskense]|uniref:hypothetical protein n=1 Tax=Halarchaeum nitratireducens TaxID=489913 RepID=UPI001B3AAFC1|nr:hypothetical protein [Halarchaeum solikamskense]MBP2251563.1 uncharacterized protein (DUF697 family) [Halarchaeum solikamskense]